jgi:hypothetical protein
MTSAVKMMMIPYYCLKILKGAAGGERRHWQRFQHALLDGDEKDPAGVC